MSYKSWEDLLDEDEGSEDVAGDAVAQAQSTLEQPLLPEDNPFSSVVDTLDKATLPTELESLAKKIPGMDKLMAERDALRSQLAQLTGQAPKEERSLFGQRASGGDSQAAPPRWERIWGAPLTEHDDPEDPTEDEARDARRDAARHSPAARTADVFDRARKRTEAEPAAAIRGTPSRAGRARNMPDPAKTSADTTRRMEKRLQHLQERPGSPKRQARAAKLKQKLGKRRETQRKWEAVRERQREKQAAMRRAQSRMNERQQRIQNGPAWLPKPGVGSGSETTLASLGRAAKKLALDRLGSTWGNRDGRFDMDDLFRRDEKKAEERRKKAEERRREKRREERRAEEKAKSKKEKRREERRNKRKK